MRLDRVYIDGFKNLKDVEVDFNANRLTTVIIGQNGTGKSNLIEAITTVFRFVDLGDKNDIPKFSYEIEYRIDNKKVRLTNLKGNSEIFASGKKLTVAEFQREKEKLFPDLVFGYYSGGSRRLEKLFDTHQRRYYDKIKLNDNIEECKKALLDRRLFYCRPIHGVFALLSSLSFPENKVISLLNEKLGITGFHSALALFHRPWYAKSPKRDSLKIAPKLWNAKGPAGRCARALCDVAFHPIALEDTPIDDYREKGVKEQQYAAFIRNYNSLEQFSNNYQTDQEMFAALEAVDISDLYRKLHLWVKRKNDSSGDVGFTDLSDGERQLLMVLGLIRVSRGKKALFLLDEPDTHLNPVWQHAYLDLIKEWTGIAADESNCHIVMTSHNPLTITALEKEEVRVMFTDDKDKVSVSEPYTDPRGMGFTATLTEIFGLQSSLDIETQREVDKRNVLAKIEKRTARQEKELIKINDKLNRLGFLFEDREPLYQDFLRSWQDVQYADRPPLSPEQIENRHKTMSNLIKELIKKNEVKQ